MKAKRLRILIVEIFKTLHDSNPVFMKDIFHYCQNKSHKKHNLHVHSRNTSRYGNKCLRVLGAHIWNSLPENIKCTDSVYELKNFLKGWCGCKCYLCIVQLCHLRGHVLFLIYIKNCKQTILLYHYAQSFQQNAQREGQWEGSRT